MGRMNPILITIANDPRKQRFQYFWIKYVRGVDLEQHCQKCLRGPTSKRVSSSQFAQAKRKISIDRQPLDEGRYRAIYICGVSCGMVWEKNFHLPVCYCEGHVEEREVDGLRVIVENATSLAIKSSAIDKGFHRAGEESYYTCRNAQFAWGLDRGLYDKVIEAGSPKEQAQRLLF